MTETLSFPGLGLEFRLNPVIVQITDEWAIKWYGVIIMLAFAFACWYVLRRAPAFGLDPDRVLDVTLGAVLGGIVGARLYYVFFFDWPTYRADPIRILKTWQGGIAIYGGIIGGVLVGLLLCRWRKVKPLPMLDLASAALLMGQAIGRWGNFVNMEAFGGNTTMPWGMTSPSIARYLEYRQMELASLGIAVDPSMPVHPTFFYESMWCLAGALFLMWYTRYRRYDGEMALIYAGWYGLGRLWIEGLRTDSLMLGPVRVSQMLALLCVIASVAAMLVIRGKIRRGDNPALMTLYVDTEEGQTIQAAALLQELERKAGTGRPEVAPVWHSRDVPKAQPPVRKTAAEKQLRGKQKLTRARLGHRALRVRRSRRR